MIKGIIFDMDGTILNTIDDIKDSVNHAMKICDLPLKTLQEVKDGVGRGAINLIEDVVPKHLSQEDIKIVYKIYQDHYDKNSNHKTGPYPGILALLKKLKEMNYKLAVVSNKHKYLVEELNHNIFKDYFDFSMGEVKGVPIKPEPDMLYMALDHLGLKKSEVLFIGDSDVDMITANNAGITSVGVTWGFRSKDVLIKHQASYIIDQPDQLLEIIKEVE
ncbi:HAD family hydrolase [Mariniplasma anaerobium]|uniref:Phosphoglycolate phosphatase n=1 Tax=Mariniplasma anaerobium TaxID=2735436 RepID=A0A7U9TLG6_9MOLU|nr:HAD family hydrolase [Mariniplasma anaerobium]BCR35924.1 phosphoglycolate phosphatase [Mariniplasma anaerobium]